MDDLKPATSDLMVVDPVNLANMHSSTRQLITPATPLMKRKKLSLMTKLAFSLGHVFNDMTVSIWFSYTLLFFVYRLPGAMPGNLLLMGQIADAICSPLVGLASDFFKHTWPFNKLGCRKSWHFIGVALSAVSVPLVYNKCLLGDDQPVMVQFAYYGVLVCVFQAAWAMTQVTHVALINDLSELQEDRIALNAYRQAASMVANIVMYMMSLYLLESTGSDGSGNGTLSNTDLAAFTQLAYYVCILGCFLSALFYVFVNEHDPEPCIPEPADNIVVYTTEASGIESSVSFEHMPDDMETGALGALGAKPGKKSWMSWFRSTSFWNITAIYTCARMFVNVSQVYIPLYLQYYLQLPKETLSIIPLVINVASFGFSFMASFLSKHYGSRVSLLLGLLAGMFTSLWILVGDHFPFFATHQIYVLSAFCGISGTSLLISSLGLNSDLVGVNNAATNAFVFAAMSFFDKSINGVAIALLEEFKPAEDHLAPMPYYKYIMVSLTGVPSLLILVFFFAIYRTKYGIPSGPQGNVHFGGH